MNSESPVERINRLVEKISSTGKNFTVLQETSAHVLQVPAGDIKQICRKLKETEPLYFLHLSDITVVDYPKKQARFQLNYQLFSFKLNHQLQLKINISENQAVYSLRDIWPGAEIMEEEISELFGIEFLRNDEQQNCFLNCGSSVSPLRKDYPKGREQQ